MAKLIQLKNGNWIDPRTVVGIVFLPGGKGEFSNTEYPVRVRIDMEVGGTNRFEFIVCESVDNAVQMKDDLAALVNNAEE